MRPELRHECPATSVGVAVPPPARHVDRARFVIGHGESEDVVREHLAQRVPGFAGDGGELLDLVEMVVLAPVTPGMVVENEARSSPPSTRIVSTKVLGGSECGASPMSYSMGMGAALWVSKRLTEERCREFGSHRRAAGCRDGPRSRH